MDAGKRQTRRQTRKRRDKELDADSGTTRKVNASDSTVKEPVSKRKKVAKSAQGPQSAARSATVSEKPTSSSSCAPKDCEPAKKRRRKALTSSSFTKSKGLGASSQVAEPMVEQSEPTEEPTKKRTRKTLSKKERQALVDYISKVDLSLLSDVVRIKLGEQCLADHLQTFADALFGQEILIRDILLHHRVRFGELYIQCKEESDPFLQFQLKWHQHCAAFLLSRDYSLATINLEECAQQSIAALRLRWLDYCDQSTLPFSDTSKVMMTLSSAVYDMLLERVQSFQEGLSTSVDTTSNSNLVSNDPDSDDVCLRFGGAAICEMLKLRYDQIKKCSDTQRDQLSQEITILKAMTMKDKTSLPIYLKYRDRGFMYFPDPSFVMFIQGINEAVRSVASTNSLDQDVVKVQF